MYNKNFKLSVYGLSILICIFFMSTFCLFSYQIISTERSLLNKNLTSLQEYYKSDKLACDIVNELRSGEVPEIDLINRDSVTEFTVPVNENQDLLVEVDFSNDSYEILCWTVVYNGDWEVEDTFTLWDGII